MAVTVEGLLVEVGKAFEPLERRLAAGEVEVLFAELGLPAPDAVLGAPGVVSALGDVADAAANLGPIVTDLADAIEAEDGVAIGAAIVQAAPAVSAVVAAVDTIANAIDGAAAGPASAEVEAFASDLPVRLVGYLVSGYLDLHRPVIGGVAALLGIVESTPQPATANAPAHVRRALRLDRLGPLLDDPLAAVAEQYSWGTASFDWELLLDRLVRVAGRVSDLSFAETLPDGSPVLRVGGVFDLGATDDAVPGLRASLRIALADSLDVTVPLSPGIAFEVGVAAALESGAAVELLPPGQLEIEPPTTEVSGQARAGLEVTGGGGPLTLFGTAAGARIEAGKLRVATGADLTWDVAAGRADGALVFEAAVEDGKVVLSLDGADGFLSAILPEGGFAVDFDVLAGWSSERGLYFEGGAALAVDIPVDFDLGPIRIQMLHLELGLAADGLTLEASGAISATLGPFAMAVDRMGTRARLTFPDTGGNLGPANLALEFKPPSGIGLSLDAGVVAGGGYLYLDPEKGEYAGVLELAFGPVSIKAIGILTTKLPGGAEGWALLLLVFGEFPAIQLGYGFTLNGVGGIIGLQHGVSIDALQSGLRTGVLDSVLFPRDPVANAPTLIRELRVVFPIVPRALTLGPALKLGWSTPPLVTVSLGLVLQFDDVLGAGPGPPSLSRIVLVGQLKVQIPPVDELGIDAPALIHLQVDVVGAYDFREQALSIDAVLRDSHVALLPVTGSLVVRARFGADATFVLAVGGFHPRFTDIPPGIPAQTRVGIDLRYGIVVVRIVGYFAITSNTVQTGAEASLVAAGGGFRIEAYLGFDALFVFEPVFHFEIDFRVGAAVKYKSISLASLRVTGVLTGPGRWEVSGHASISLLFFDVDIDFEVGWGSAPAPALPSVRVGSAIAAAMSAPDAWTAQLPAGGTALVTLRGVDGGTDVLAHPLGEVVGVQKVVPLGITIDRVGRSVPSDGNRFDITGVEIGGDGETPAFRDEHFARGEFLDLTEEQKLSMPSFERFRAGVAVSTADFQVPADQVSFDPVWETVFLPDPAPPVSGVVAGVTLVAQARFGAVAHSQLRAADRLASGTDATVTVGAPTYTVVSGADPSTPMAGEVVTTFTEAAQHAAGAKSALVTDVAEVVAGP